MSHIVRVLSVVDKNGHCEILFLDSYINFPNYDS